MHNQLLRKKLDSRCLILALLTKAFVNSCIFALVRSVKKLFGLLAHDRGVKALLYDIGRKFHLAQSDEVFCNRSEDHV